jgi:light-regulated signal transduction histidine kinase (bacteriophytochrome)
VKSSCKSSVFQFSLDVAGLLQRKRPLTNVKSSSMTEVELVFFGRIMASMSHELQNVIATINEFSGLMEDLIGGAGTFNRDRLHALCRKINKHTSRGETLIQCQNRFSHSLDPPRQKRTDLNMMLDDICGLSNRFAALKRVRLERCLPATETVIMVDTFAFQHAVFLCIDLAIDAASERRVVTVSLANDGSCCKVFIDSEDPVGEILPARGGGEVLQGILTQLNATATLEGTAGKARIVVALPQR